MYDWQASTENAEAFDRLNRRLDNEVKNFTAMVKEVIANIISVIIIIDCNPMSIIKFCLHMLSAKNYVFLSTTFVKSG